MKSGLFFVVSGERILIPEECIPYAPFEEAYDELRQHIVRNGGHTAICWFAHEARKRGLPGMLCEAWVENRAGNERLFIKALQPADCFPDAGAGHIMPCMARSFRRELDKELYLRITDLLNEIKELAQPEASGTSRFPNSDYTGLEMVGIQDEIRLELIQSASLADFHERLLPLLKQEVDTLHSTEYLLGLLRGDAYLRPDAE